MVRRAGPTRAKCGRPGFSRPPHYLPRWLRRLAGTLGLAASAAAARSASILAPGGRWADHYLRDCGPGHVLVMAPTRSGKGVNTMVPTLLTWPHSALIHDFKGELWPLTAGARQHMGQLCLKFDPADPDDTSVKYNPLEEVRLRTAYETEDVQNIVQMLVDPRRARAQHDHWVQAGTALLTGAILHMLYAEPSQDPARADRAS